MQTVVARRQPAPRRRVVGRRTVAPALQAPSPIQSQNEQSVNATPGGSTTLQPDLLGTLLNVYLPSTAVQVGSAYTAGVQSAIPFSGNPQSGQPFQFILDGEPGTLTFTWYDNAINQQTQFAIKIQGQYGSFNPPPPPGSPSPPPYPLPLPYRGPPFPIKFNPNPPVGVPNPTGAPSPAPSPTASSTSSSAWLIAGLALAAAAAGGYAYYRYRQHPRAHARPRRR